MMNNYYENHFKVDVKFQLEHIHFINLSKIPESMYLEEYNNGLCSSVAASEIKRKYLKAIAKAEPVSNNGWFDVSEEELDFTKLYSIGDYFLFAYNTGSVYLFSMNEVDDLYGLEEIVKTYNYDYVKPMKLEDLPEHLIVE